MAPDSIMAVPLDGPQHLTDRLAARALRLALDPYLDRCHGAAELVWLAGDRPSHLARARRRLRCGESERRSRIAAQAEQLLADAQCSAETWTARLPDRERLS
jgi:hypothetical protein